MNGENTYKTVFQRVFLTAGLPGEIKPADSHLQIFDNYIAGTRMRLRKVRVPETKEWTRSFEQICPVREGNFEEMKISKIILDEAEYLVLKSFEGREVRKNRYFYETDGKSYEIDIHLGKLWGLNIAKACFESKAERDKSQPPDFAVLEITGDGFFAGTNLVEKEFADVQNRLAGK